MPCKCDEQAGLCYAPSGVSHHKVLNIEVVDALPVDVLAERCFPV